MAIHASFRELNEEIAKALGKSTAQGKEEALMPQNTIGGSPRTAPLFHGTAGHSSSSGLTEGRQLALPRYNIGKSRLPRPRTCLLCIPRFDREGKCIRDPLNVTHGKDERISQLIHLL